MESLNSIKETIDVFLLVFAPISINLYLQVIGFCSQNKVELFRTLLSLMLADTSLNITIRGVLLFMPPTAWVKSGTIDWQSAHLTVQSSPLAFQQPALTYHVVPYSTVNTECLQFILCRHSIKQYAERESNIIKVIHTNPFCFWYILLLNLNPFSWYLKSGVQH